MSDNQQLEKAEAPNGLRGLSPPNFLTRSVSAPLWDMMSFLDVAKRLAENQRRTPAPTILPEVAEEARTLRAGIVESLTAVSAEWLGHRIAGILQQFFVNRPSNAVAGMIGADWREDLGEFPQWAIEAAWREWRRSNPKRPSSADLRKLCVIETQDWMRRIATLDTIIELRRRQKGDPRRQVFTKRGIEPVADDKPHLTEQDLAKMEEAKAAMNAAFAANEARTATISKGTKE